MSTVAQRPGAFDFQSVFDQALSYDAFLERYGTPDQIRRWAAMFDRVQLTAAQRALLAGFRREMPVLCMAGAWCGDCVDQCPILARFAEATDRIRLRFIDRDASDAVKAELSVCGGARVPSVVFLSEDGQFVARFGDRTLAKYRSLTTGLDGAACSTGLVPPPQTLLDAVVQEWLDQFERAQLILRTSPRLRQKHGD